MDWKTCLGLCHDHMWSKWQKVKNKSPLKTGQHEQIPGEVPQHDLEKLRPIIEGMKPPVDYAAKRSKK